MAGTWNFGNFWFLEKCPVLFFLNPQKNGVWKNPVLPGSKIPLLAIHKIISHIWEDRSRKVNNDEPGFRFFHGNFWPVISQAVRKPCFSAWIPRGPNFWKPWICGYVAAGVFFPQKRGPYFWKPWTCGYVAAGAFFFPQKRDPYFWARIHQIWARIMRARHGNPPPPVKGGTGVFLTRHGTSESPESERL